jgi:hypothetical protein
MEDILMAPEQFRERVGFPDHARSVEYLYGSGYTPFTVSFSEGTDHDSNVPYCHEQWGLWS